MNSSGVAGSAVIVTRAIDRAFAQLPPAQRPRAVETRRPHVRRPRRPLRRLQRERLGEVIDAPSRPDGGVRRTAVGVSGIARRRARRGGTPGCRRADTSRDASRPAGPIRSCVRRCEITRPSEWHLLHVALRVGVGGVLVVDPAAARLPTPPAWLLPAPGRDCSRGTSRPGARSAGSMFSPLSAAMRWIGRLPALGRVALKRDARHLALVVGPDGTSRTPSARLRR